MRVTPATASVAFMNAWMGASLEATQLSMAASETVIHRMVMIQRGMMTGDPKAAEEIWRMTAEKPAAFLNAAERFMRPLRVKAAANARRLRG